MNLALVAGYLDPAARTAVDIGCNEGAITCLLSMMGVEATGYEQSVRAIRTANRLSAALGLTVGFENRLVKQEDIAARPASDITMFLSVHHQIAAHSGFPAADAFLQALAEKTRLQLFFQPACIARKYRQSTPFPENDLGAISEHFISLVGDRFPHAAVIGFTPNDIPRSEPLRPLILFSRNPIRLHPERSEIDLVFQIRKAARRVSVLGRLLS